MFVVSLIDGYSKFIRTAHTLENRVICTTVATLGPIQSHLERTSTPQGMNTEHRISQSTPYQHENKSKKG